MQICLTVIEGPHQGQVFTFAGHDTFLVGRSSKAHFRLPHKDKYFSRVHFLMEVNPPRCRLVDVGSRNGTFVNGQKVSTQDLKDGDLITAGHSVLRLAVQEGPSDTPGDATVAHTATTPAAGEIGFNTEQISAQPIDGYEVIKELGRGGMGVVYLAKRRTDGSQVALKTVIPNVAASPAQLERFVREAVILQALDHPNIVRCVDIGESNGRLFFAMEYVAGNDAQQLLRQRGPLPVRMAVGIVCQLLKALEFAHEKKFVHRDIKPSNLLVAKAAEGAVVKLADFGLARIYQSSQLSGLTMTGDVGGSMGFMPPEQITAYREAQPPADQYAAAATLYTLLTDKYVFDLPRELHKQFAMVLNDDPVPILQRRPDLPRKLAAAIHRALAREPADRFPDVKAFRKALVEVMQAQAS